MGTKIDIDEVYAAQKDAETRREQIRLEIKALELQEREIEASIEEYAITVRTLRQFIRPSDNASDGSDQDEADEDGGLPRGTARHLIENALNTFARDGKTAGEIREYIRNRHKIEIPANTLSVTLNRLKAATLAKLTGQKWQPAAPPPPEEGFSGPQWTPAKAAPDLDDDIPF